MKILDKIFGSDHHLTRPNFNSAKTLNFNLSDNIIALRDAPHTATTPIYDNVYSLDIYDREKMEQSKSGEFAEKIYSRGWNFYGKGKEARGGVILSSVVHYFPEDIFPNINLFDADCLKRYALAASVVLFGMSEKNTKSPKGYPTKEGGLKKENYGGFDWYLSPHLRASDGAEFFYYLPLSKIHMLDIGFDFSSYHGLDIYSPETNLKDTIETVIHDFMSHVKITYSKRSLEEKNATTSKG